MAPAGVKLHLKGCKQCSWKLEAALFAKGSAHSCEMKAVLVMRCLMLLQAVHHNMPCCSSRQVLKVRPQLCVVTKICRGTMKLVSRR